MLTISNTRENGGGGCLRRGVIVSVHVSCGCPLSQRTCLFELRSPVRIAVCAVARGQSRRSHVGSTRSAIAVHANGTRERLTSSRSCFQSDRCMDSSLNRRHQTRDGSQPSGTRMYVGEYVWHGLPQQCRICRRGSSRMVLRHSQTASGPRRSTLGATKPLHCIDDRGRHLSRDGTSATIIRHQQHRNL